MNDIKNQFNKLTQPIFEAFNGPRTKDFMFENKYNELKIAKERVLMVKRVIDNYPARLEGLRITLVDIQTNFEQVFDSDQRGYKQFMANYISAHKALNDKLTKMFANLERLKVQTDEWINHYSDVNAKIKDREKKRETFDHYDEKMAELNNDRKKDISKGNEISDKDNERFSRNIKKYQEAANEYILSSNQAYKAMSQVMDARYDNISNGLANLAEIEREFFNEGAHIMNFFTNIKSNAISLRNSLFIKQENYDASNFIRGKGLLNYNSDEILRGQDRIKGYIPKGGNNVVISGEKYGVKNYSQNNYNNNNNNQGGNYEGGNPSYNNYGGGSYNNFGNNSCNYNNDGNNYNFGFSGNSFNNQGNNYGNNNNNYGNNYNKDNFDNQNNFRPNPYDDSNNNNFPDNNPYGDITKGQPSNIGNNFYKNDDESSPVPGPDEK